jgi:hypothetical protein
LYSCPNYHDISLFTYVALFKLRWLKNRWLIIIDATTFATKSPCVMFRILNHAHSHALQLRMCGLTFKVKINIVKLKDLLTMHHLRIVVFKNGFDFFLLHCFVVSRVQSSLEGLHI